MARGLRIADAISKSSDPYAEIHLPGNKKINSPTIDKTLSPVWNFQHKHYVNILQKDYKDVKITVRDSDQMAVDDELGFIELNWQHLITEQNLGQWLINDVFKLRGDEKYGVDLGEIYIQCRFLAAAETNSSVAA